MHHRMRQCLAGAFSTKALAEQEDAVQGAVDEFLEKVGEEGSSAGKGGGEGGYVDLTMWFEVFAFDVLGQMAFGMAFGGVRSGTSRSVLFV